MSNRLRVITFVAVAAACVSCAPLFGLFNDRATDTASRSKPPQGTASELTSGNDPRDLEAGATPATSDLLSSRKENLRTDDLSGSKASPSCQPLPMVQEVQSQSRTTAWWQHQPFSASPSTPKQSIERHRLPRTTRSPLWTNPATGRSAERQSFVAANQFADSPAAENDFGDTPRNELEYPKSIELAVGEFRVIRIGGRESGYANVIGFSQSDQGVCEAMVSGRTKLHVIGTSEGETQLAISTEVGGQDPRSMKCEISVRVKKQNERVDARLQAQIDAIERAIGKAFPNCRIRIEPVSKRLVVSGKCDSKDSRDRIMDIVRGICLTWVEDKLETPGLEQQPLIYPEEHVPSCLSGVPSFPALPNGHLSN